MICDNCANSIVKAAGRMLAAALEFSADQGGATSQLVGLVQPVSVADCVELNEAIGELSEALSAPNPREAPINTKEETQCR